MSTAPTRPDFGFVRVAAAVPPLRVADIDGNLRHILDFAARADEQGAQIVAFPELSLTSYTAGDLFHQHLLLERAAEALLTLARASQTLRPLLIVGVPLAAGGNLFNTAAVISRGILHGVVPKTYIPGYKEYTRSAGSRRRATWSPATSGSATGWCRSAPTCCSARRASRTW